VNLLDVRTFTLPRTIAHATSDALRRAGENGYELIALWSGKHSGRKFTVENIHVPRQYSMQADAGALTQVLGDELHRLNIWLLEHCQTVGVQIHSHPHEAYHSDTDDDFAIATLLGGLSIVVPHFGRDGVLGRGSAAYRLMPEGWVRVDKLATIVEVTDR
jgi:hypothetical protein